MIKDLLDYKLLPAPPGFTLWHRDPKDGELHSPTPIIGWIIERNRCSDDKT
jgi:hypothetical protein